MAAPPALATRAPCSQNCLLANDGAVKLTDFGSALRRAGRYFLRCIDCAVPPAALLQYRRHASRPQARRRTWRPSCWPRSPSRRPPTRTRSASCSGCVEDTAALALSTLAPVLPWQELLARRIPFAGWRPPDIRDAVIKGTRPDMGALPLDVPAALRDLIVAGVLYNAHVMKKNL